MSRDKPVCKNLIKVKNHDTVPLGIVLVLSLSTVSKAAFVVIFHQSHTNKLFFHQHDSNKTFFHQVHSNKAFYQHDSNKAFLKDFINIFHPVFPMSSGECCVQLSRELSRQNQP